MNLENKINKSVRKMETVIIGKLVSNEINYVDRSPVIHKSKVVSQWPDWANLLAAATRCWMSLSDKMMDGLIR